MTTVGLASKPRVWVHAARLPTLPAAIVPVIVGSAAAAAHGYLRPAVVVVALAAAVLIQIGTNLANDYFDFRKGADAVGRLGPVRVTQSGLIAPEVVLRATIVVFGLAGLCGLYLAALGGWPIVVVGVLSIAAGTLYTGGPWPLGYHGLGDLFVFVFFGLVAVMGTFYLHVGVVTWTSLLDAIPVGFLATAILVVNNVRDIDGDRASGKRTLAVIIGRRATRLQYAFLIAGSYVVPLARWLGDPGTITPLLPWLTLPLAIPIVRFVASRQGPDLNRALRKTGQLHLIFGLLFALSLWR